MAYGRVCGVLRNTEVTYSNAGTADDHPRLPRRPATTRLVSRLGRTLRKEDSSDLTSLIDEIAGHLHRAVLGSVSADFSDAQGARSAVRR